VARIKKTLSEQEKTLHDIIKEAQRKLEKLQSKQQLEIGELACKHGLNEFSLEILDKAFNRLATELKNI
jgi:hypothetical protein